ncbi:lipase/serine esteras-like protein [Boeremia exigua]|uniref:lipase/serine esterase-like protein n=1 Tax=Boeremia exigua TaxID=749465 RepID=UPI001E8D5797|nr:lipase/serine esterase-like protein [Boeremia exigua]KAH6625310.1 lipase/serine esteras-like protein [Boeremia exigua]
MATSTSTNTSRNVTHLVVLVHGLWGNPAHLKYLTDSIRERYPDLDVLVPKNNSGSFTYDGIELGGERVADEVETRLEELKQEGHTIEKFSITGYSLGGLVARYAIGLLYHKGVFEQIQPVNFTTFATPHLGVRTPLKGYTSHVWNVLGARTLSTSGRQLFAIDEFRDTGRPILAVLADPSAIFIKALAQFETRSLYANIVNDRTVTYYTAGISQTDPYVKPDDVQMNYVPGYEDVIIDGEKPVLPKQQEPPQALMRRLTASTRVALTRVPLFAFLVVFIPVGTTLFLCNSAIQSVRSQQRIRLHEAGAAGIETDRYRVPLMLNAARKEVEDMFENVNNAHEQEYLGVDSEEFASPTQPTSPRFEDKNPIADIEATQEAKPGSLSHFPALALRQDQFSMIEALDNVGFKKFPVYIHNHRHSHAAIIVRMDKKSFDEGRVVVKHWLDNFKV